MQLTVSNLMTLSFATAIGAPTLAIPRSGTGWPLFGIIVSMMSFLVLAGTMPRKVMSKRKLLSNAYLLFATTTSIAFVSVIGIVIHPPNMTTGFFGGIQGFFDVLGWAMLLGFSIVLGGVLSLITALIGLWIKRTDRLPNVYVAIPAAVSGLTLLCPVLLSLIA